jgi:hypothetical protein
VRRERGLSAEQAGDQPLRSARAADAGLRPQAGGPDGAPRQLVDRARVQVVDERVCVPVERIGAHRGRRGRDALELVGHDLVERRAPERVPAAVARLEMRVDEPFGDSAARGLDHGEHGLRRVAELERARIQVEELGQRQPAPGNAVARPGDVGDRRQSAFERRRRQVAVGIAQHRERGRVLLPEELERGRSVRFRGWGRLGQNHAA